MATNQTSFSLRSFPLQAILVGGILAGTLDAVAAFHAFGWRMTYGIASGVLGSKALPAAGGGSAAIGALGLALHFLIALGAAAVYGVSSRKLVFLRDNFLICGIFFGIAVFLVMNLVVLPLSAVPFPIGPFSAHGLRTGIFYHIILIGLPISASAWFFSRKERLS